MSIEIGSSYYEAAAKKLDKKLSGLGKYENAVCEPVRECLKDFCTQNDEFAQAVAQGGSFSDCMKAVAKNCGSSISDLEAYRRAAAFYFPGSKVRFEMHIDLIGEAGESAAAETPSVTGANAGDSSSRGGAKGGLVLNLADFF